MSAHITAASSGTYKRLTRLVKSKKARDQLTCFSIEGTKAITDALNAGWHCIDLFSKGEIHTSIDTTSSTRCYSLSPSLYNQVSLNPNSTHIGLFKKKPDALFNTTWQRLFFLDALQDPSNVGAIFRSARAFGIDAIVFSNDCVDSYHPKVWRSSVGAVAHVPFLVETENFWTQCQGYQILGLDARAKKYVNQLDSGPCIYVFGSEGQGISSTIQAKCNDFISIPIQKNADSLNVAVSAGIIAYLSNQH